MGALAGGTETYQEGRLGAVATPPAQRARAAALLQNHGRMEQHRHCSGHYERHRCFLVVSHHQEHAQGDYGHPCDRTARVDHDGGVRAAALPERMAAEDVCEACRGLRAPRWDGRGDTR